MSSLLFKRQQNIEENNKKLESLGFFSSIFSNPIINPTITSSKTESISTPRSITQEFSLPNYKRNFYPYRVTQASDLYSHLSIDTSLTPFPALITGPPGQGKSSITNEILSQLAIPSSGAAYPRLLIHIRCRIYKDTRSFIIGVWTIIGESFQEYLSNRKSEDRPIPATLTMSLFEKLTIPKNFGDLCTVLRKFLSEVNQKLDDVNNQSNYTNKHNITNNNNNRYGSSTNISSGSSASSSYSNNNNNTGRKSSLGGSAWMRPVYIQFDHINSLELFEPGLMQVVLELPKVH